MSEKAKKIFMVIALLGLAVTAGGQVYLLTFKEGFPFMHIAALLLLIAVIAGIVYAIKGFRKNEATLFRTFLHFYALSQFASIVYSGSLTDLGNNANLIGICANVIIFGIILMLASAVDLGKKRSMGLILTVVALNVFLLIGSLIGQPGLVRGGGARGTIFAFYATSNLILSLVTTLMLVAKYKDKAARGSN